MLLKKLEAYGFKSFADRIEIDFHEGITAIVGPNGSGKSNITDAVRWVLGEQNIRSLRGSKAEDIIFAGSSARKQSGVAQVSLTFDNEDGTLPLEFQEVTIARRLFRSGESEFYINKARCRLKDIYTLFSDTGIGKNSISVISQNKVDEVLNAKPEERRLIFEECAGITKYRDRKKDAVKKLENAQSNMLRLNDICAEIEKQLEPLSLEAQRTAQYNDIKSKYDSYKLSHILCSYEKYAEENKNYEGQQKSLQQQKDNLDSSLQSLEAQNASFETVTQNLEKNLEEVGSRSRKLSEEIERGRGKCSILEERIRQNSHSMNLLKESIEKVTAQKEAAQENLRRMQEDIASADAKESDVKAQLAAAQIAVQNSEKEIAAKEKALQQYRQSFEEKRRAQEQRQHKLTLLQRDIKEKEKALQEKEKERTAQHAEKQQLTKQLEQIKEQETADKDAQKNCQTETELLKQQKKIAEEKLHSAEKKCAKLNQQTDRTRERIKILTNMQKAYEGFGSGVKGVLTASAHFWHKGVCGSVAELISVEKEYITAIQVTLGAAMQNIITQDTQTAKEAIEFLKKNRLGRVTFLPLSVIKARYGAREILSSFPGFIAYGDELIKTAPKYKEIIKNLAGRTVIVDNIDNALNLAKKKNYTLRVVTLAGEILHAGGAMSGGSLRKEIGFLNRSEEIKQLAEKTDRTVKELLLAKTNLAEQMAEIASKEKQLEENDKEIQQYTLANTEKNVKIKHLQEDIKKVALLLEQNDIFREALKKEITALQMQCRPEDKEDTEQLSLDAFNDKVTATSQKITQSKAERAKLQQELLKRASEAAAMTQNLKGTKEKIALVAADCKRCADSLQSSFDEQTRLQSVIDESVQELAQLQISNKNLQQLHTAGRGEYDKLYAQLMDRRIKNKDLEQQRKDTSEQINSLQEQLHQLDLKMTKISFELEQCERKLMEDYQLSPQEALNHKLDIEDNVLVKEIKKMQASLAEIGTVNPNAVKEYEELSTRHEFMQTQINDLVNAKENLEQIIEQMNTTMTKQFKEAFRDIGGYFDIIFKKLFGGGQASLFLTTPDDVLSSGVEITVQTPGKKKQNLALLSGGERTLTVIALLFSFLQYSPAPFSVLDEIDAPLDEANIERFSTFLRDYAAKTQFIVVTHRRGTMEAADVMYGVTMEEAGVSKIISVKMEEGVND